MAQHFYGHSGENINKCYIDLFAILWPNTQNGQFSIFTRRLFKDLRALGGEMPKGEMETKIV